MSRLKIQAKQKNVMRQWVVRSVSIFAILITTGLTIFFLAEKEDAFAKPGNGNSSKVDTDKDGIYDIDDEDDDNDGIPDTTESIIIVKQFINGSFEEGPFPSTTGMYSDALVNGWTATVSGKKIEIWKSGASNIIAPHGNYFCEVNSTDKGMIYQDITVTTDDVIEYSFYHRGRNGKDELEVLIGPTNKLKKEMKAKTDNNGWKRYTGSYKVPKNTTTLRFAFSAKKSHGKVDSEGNFIDHINLKIVESEDVDFDGDGIPNRLDLDSDNDGIYDVVEAGGIDPDGDGMIGSGKISDKDKDGLADEVDADYSSGTPLPVYDTDGDTKKDYVDFDSDGDGIVDMVEACETDQFTALSGSDSDGDGIDNVFDQSKAAIVLADTDNDGSPDYLDLDSDGDGISDAIEAFDVNADGQIDVIFSNGDYDADGVDNTIDVDSTSQTNIGGSENDQSPLDFPKVNSSSTEPNWRLNTSSANLPIDLLSFMANEDNGDVKIIWQTASEINNDYFIIERSYSGFHYEAIGTWQGSGTSNQLVKYEYVDEKPRVGVIYYRLTQVDFDGKSETFTPVSISLEKAQVIFEIDKVYPNPFYNQFTVRFIAQEEAKLEVKVYDNRGVLVINRIEYAYEGTNEFQVVDERNLKPGFYYCFIQSETQRSKGIKIIKTKP